MLRGAEPDVTKEVMAAAREPGAADKSACTESFIVFFWIYLHTDTEVAEIDDMFADVDGGWENTVHDTCTNLRSERHLFTIIRPTKKSSQSRRNIE